MRRDTSLVGYPMVATRLLKPSPKQGRSQIACESVPRSGVRDLLVALALVATTTGTVWGRPGDLDPTFGSGGLATTVFGGSTSARVSAIAVQGDGKILVAGDVSSGSDRDFALARYNPDGTADSTFGTGGRVITDVAASDDFVKDVVLQSDGKIVLAGGSFTFYPEGYYTSAFVIARYNSTGTLDPTFGVNGLVTTQPGNRLYADQGAVVVEVRADAKLVAVGYVVESGVSFAAVAVARYNADGSLDPTFGTGGTATYSGFGYLSKGVVQSDGKIIVVGNIIYDVFPPGEEILVARLTANGDVDPTFSPPWPTGLSTSGGSAVAPQGDGKVVVVGQIDGYTMMARLAGNGSLDPTFGVGGMVRTDFCQSQPFPRSAVTTQSDGRILVAGGDIVRLNSDGTLDLTFGTAGRVAGFASAITTQGDGKILAAGSSNTGGPHFVLGRYLNEPCGNGVVDPGETCDDGNLGGGDGCDPNCQIEPVTTTSTTSSTTTTTVGCGIAPHGGCIVPSRAVVTAKEASPGNEKLTVSMLGLAEALSQGQFGNPATGSTRYDLCIFDGADTLVSSLTIDRAARVCGDPPKACWRPVSVLGYRYKDQAASADGVRALLLKGGPAGLGKVTLKAGNNSAKGKLSLPTGLTGALNGTDHVTVELISSDGECFGGVMHNVTRADLGLFRANGIALGVPVATTSTTTSTSSTTSTTICAATSGSLCDLGNGTVSDAATGLQWEKKTTSAGSGVNAGDLHDVDNRYSWAGKCTLNTSKLCQPTPEAEAVCEAQTPSVYWPVGCEQCSGGDGACNVNPEAYGGITTVWEWLSQLNAAHFGGHNDWRLPSEVGRSTCPAGNPLELETILVRPYPCDLIPCIDPIFGSFTEDDLYWSETTVAPPGSAATAWGVGFYSYYAGYVTAFAKTHPAFVRAVR
jgi:uncharacterized delta-60 repeat protein